MEPLATRLEADGLRTLCLGYASTRDDLEQHADRLNRLLDGIEPAGLERISFVTHSMGGLVLREALAHRSAWRTRFELGRVVQLGPPNRGSRLARWVWPTPIGWLLGPCLRAVATHEARCLPPLPCETLVIAGGRGGHGWNPLVPGDDDGVVGVAEAHLPGCELVVVHELHTVLMKNEEVANHTLDFLRTGS